MRTDLFDYDLPEELIAQEPLPVRDASRLMVVDRSTSAIEDRGFDDLLDYLEPGDCMVINSSRVIPARLHATKTGTGGAVELLLLEKLSKARWTAMSRGAKVRPGAVLELEKGVSAEIQEGPTDGVVVVEFSSKAGDVERALESLGEVPLPPYIHRPVEDPERYQTVYSEREISAAAPTAGLHFTPALLEAVEARGVTIARLELAVGIDTFVPVREEDTEDHRMHEEWYSVGESAARAVNGCDGKVFSVGTTVVRALESAALKAKSGDRVAAASGRTSLFITPGYEFRAVDALVTNFHFPRSTLIMLVAAFAGQDQLFDAYRHAIAERYRFYSFGDAMLVL
jgi:S-adenosylmethionine:tRNA ribosyltransferase-isomerase